MVEITYIVLCFLVFIESMLVAIAMAGMEYKIDRVAGILLGVLNILFLLLSVKIFVLP